MTTTTTTTTTILPRTTPLVVFSRHHHRAVEVDARSGIFACQTTRSSVTGTRTWKKTPSLLSMLLFGIALRRSFFFYDKCVSYRGIRLFFLSFFSFLSRRLFLVPFFSGFPSSAATSPRFFFPSAGHKNVRKQNNNKSRNTFCVLRIYYNTFTTQHILLLERSVIPRRRERERERESEKETHGRNARKRRDRRERERGRESVVPEK